jgi:hypothetical protein
MSGNNMNKKPYDLLFDINSALSITDPKAKDKSTKDLH